MKQKLKTVETEGPDILIQNFGTWCVLWPRTRIAELWIQENVEVVEMWGNGILCEPRFADDITEHLLACHLSVLRA